MSERLGEIAELALRSRIVFLRVETEVGSQPNLIGIPTGEDAIKRLVQVGQF